MNNFLWLIFGKEATACCEVEENIDEYFLKQNQMLMR